MNDVRDCSWAQWKHVGWPKKTLSIVIDIKFCIRHLVGRTVVSSKSTQSTPKLLGLRLNQNLHARYLFWAAYCLAPTTCLLLISNFNLIYNANNNGKLQYWCCLPFSPLQMSSVASLLVACRLHQLSCTCLLRHWRYCHMKVFVETR